MSDGMTDAWIEDMLEKKWQEPHMIVKDNINPNHYKQGKVECIDALESATVNLKGIDAVCTANAIKYLWRWKEKGGIEDLKKAVWYINRIIQNQPRELS